MIPFPAPLGFPPNAVMCLNFFVPGLDTTSKFNACGPDCVIVPVAGSAIFHAPSAPGCMGPRSQIMMKHYDKSGVLYGHRCPNSRPAVPHNAAETWPVYVHDFASIGHVTAGGSANNPVGEREMPANNWADLRSGRWVVEFHPTFAARTKLRSVQRRCT